MNTCPYLRSLSFAWCTALLLCCSSAQSLFAATLANFGFNTRTVNNKLSTNSRPLLIIIANFSGGVTNFRGTSYFDGLFFTNATQSVNGYFREVSNDRFSWTKAGIVGPIDFPANQRLSDSFPEARYYSNIIARVASGGWFNFKPYDRSPTNGTVDSDELQMVFVTNEGADSGGARWTDCVSSNVPNGNVNICTYGNGLLYINHQSSFSTICHELTHILNVPEDLYNQECLNSFVTLMSCTPGTNAPWALAWTWHLDPWNKMRLGWSEPRIMSVATGGVVSLPAAHLKQVDAPVILYDSSVPGTTRFFMLEYRMQRSYDSNVVNNGLAIWHVMRDQNYQPLQIPSAGARFDTETGWLPCKKCASFFYTAASTNRCAADADVHVPGGGPYFLESDNAAVPGEREWRRCRKCQGLFLAVQQSISVCPWDGLQHEPETDFNRNYSVRTSYRRGALGPWAFCFKCTSLFNSGLEAKSPFYATGTCPAGGNHSMSNHLGLISRDYYLVAYDFAMFSLFPPDLSREPGSILWSSGDTTPRLGWANGTTTTSQIRVRPFAWNDETITVEIITQDDTWVDFNYTGAFQNGDFLTPYKTTGQGVTNASWGGSLKFKPGSKNETAIIDKRLTLEAPLGPGSAILGQ
jgi:M6 family metalloprotease-like protein